MNCFQFDSDATERGNYKGLKLLEPMTKVFQRVVKQDIREVVDIDAMQLSFMLGKDTMDASFIGRQLQEKYFEKKKKLFLPL